jgi:hypothetical protein
MKSKMKSNEKCKNNTIVGSLSIVSGIPYIANNIFKQKVRNFVLLLAKPFKYSAGPQVIRKSHFGTTDSRRRTRSPLSTKM